MKDKQYSKTPTLQPANQITVGIVTISDRASAGEYDDLGGPALKQLAHKVGWHVLAEAIVPDKITPNAILSRNLAAVVDQALVIALPGKPSGALECLSFVQGAIPHGVAVAQGTPTSC